jgi:hypothetical protein
MPPIEQLVQNQYLVKIPSFGLEKLVPITRGVHVQQTMVVVIFINVRITIGLLVYGNGVPL